MIPKKVHYIWLSGEEMPTCLKMIQYIWRLILPDYEFILWDYAKYSQIPNVPTYVKEAIRLKKWAFASDWIRLYAIWSEGGWYFDSDLQLLRDGISELSHYSFVSAVENSEHSYYYYKGSNLNTQIQAAFLGSERFNPFAKELLDYYNNLTFSFNGDATLIAPTIYSNVALKYGFNPDKKEGTQKLTNGAVLLSHKHILAHKNWLQCLSTNDNPIALHHCYHGWTDKDWIVNEESVLENITNIEILKKVYNKFIIKKKNCINKFFNIFKIIYQFILKLVSNN
jgi:hypothetical protein